MTSQACTEDKLGQTGKAPGEARVQKRGNQREPGEPGDILRVSPRGWENRNLGTPALNPFRPGLSFIFGRRTTPLPFLERSASTCVMVTLVLTYSLTSKAFSYLVITMPADFITPFTKLFGMYYTQGRPRSATHCALIGIQIPLLDLLWQG